MAERKDTAWNDGLREAFAERRRRREARTASAASVARAGRFDRLDEIARDDTSVLLRAHDREVDRDVALRILAEASPPEDAVQRFLEEAQLAAQLQHPGILSVFGMGTLEDGRPFVALPVVEGPTLTEVLAEANGSPSDRRRRIALVEQVAHALAYAHARGVAHGRLDARRVHPGQRGGVAVSGWDRAVRVNGDQAPLGADVRALGEMLAAVLGEGGREGELSELAESCAAKERPRHAGEVARRIAACLAEEESRARHAELEAARERTRAEEERAAATVERTRETLARRARRRTTAAVAVLLIATIVGGAGLVRKRGEDRATAARIDSEIASALREARRHEGAERWTEASAWARKAVALARAGKSDQRGSTNELLERVEEKERVAREDAALLARLDRICTEVEICGYQVRADRATGAAFREVGIDLEGLPAVEAAAAIRARHRPVELAAALVRWAWCLGSAPAQVGGPGLERRARHLLEVARAVDPDAWHDRLLDGADLATLRALAATADVARLPVKTSLFLGSALRSLDVRAATEFLRRVRRHHPDDPSVATDLGRCAETLDPPRPEEAIRGYVVALGLVPESAHLSNYLGCVLAQQERFEEAHAVFRRAVEIDPRWSPTRANLGRALLRLGEPDEAVRQLRLAVELDPGSAYAHRFLADALEERGEYAAAVEACETALALDPFQPGCHNILGLAHHGLGELEKAIEAFHEAIDLDEGDASAWSNLGMALRDLGQLEKAREALETAIERQPDYAPAYTNLGNVLDDLGEPGTAVEAYRDAIRLDPELAEAHYNLGLTLRGQGDVPGALRSLCRARDLAPDDAETRCALGVTLCDFAGEPGKAIAEFQRAIELDPARPRYRVCLGVAHRKSGDPESAEAAFREATVVDPKSMRAWIDLGVVRAQRRDFPGAIEAWRRAVRISPENLGVIRALARLLAIRPDPRPGDPEEAIRLTEGIEPPDGEDFKTLGVALYRTGRLEKAIGALERSVEISSGGDPIDWLFLAMAHARLGHEEKARSRYAQAVAWMTDNEADDEMLERFRAEAKALIEPGDESEGR